MFRKLSCANSPKNDEMNDERYLISGTYDTLTWGA